MPRWWDRLLGRTTQTFASQAEVRQLASRARAVNAAAVDLTGAGRHVASSAQEWQREVWGYYDSLGSFKYAVNWKSDMVSRIRLRAAKEAPDRDEPEIVDKGAAADIVAQFGGGTAGQAQLMGSLETQLCVPGEGYVIGETINGVNRWTVRSLEEVRQQGERWQVVDERAPTTQQQWRTLNGDYLVARIWRPHRRWYAIADSPARGARSTMRELELVNRHIIAQYLSRLASAGIIMFPDEVTFPVRPEFQDEPDPFMAEWIEMAREAISTPGTASAVIPIPMRLSGEWIEKIKHIDFTLKIDEKVIEKRESALKKLAAEVNVPNEIMLGMGDVNHWSAWQIEESAVKAHISPDVELICSMLTESLLHPIMKAAGEDPTGWVVWYDASEITQRPDKSQNATLAYDRLELSGGALRRELGFDEDDAPDKTELADLILKLLARDPQQALTVLAELTGVSISTPAGPGGEGSSEETPAGDEAPPVEAGQEERVEPDTQAEPPPAPNGRPSPQRAETRAKIAARQGDVMHHIRFDAARQSWELLHPPECRQHTFSCPVTHMIYPGVLASPGTSGTYECYLDAFGIAKLGRRVTNWRGNPELTTPIWAGEKRNGHARPRAQPTGIS